MRLVGCFELLFVLYNTTLAVGEGREGETTKRVPRCAQIYKVLLLY